MYNKTYIILFILCNCYFSFAQPTFHGAGKSSIDFGISYSSSSSFYDLDGNSKIYTKDTFNILLDGVTEYQYALKRTFEFRKYTILLGYNMNLSDDLTLSAEVPLSLMSLKEKYEFDTNRFSPTYNSQKIISDFSLFKPDYYKISFYYTLLNGVSFPVITGAVYMPPNLTNGYQNNISGNFKYYSAYQFYLGLIYDFKFSKSFIDLESGFFYRTGDFNNKLYDKIDAAVSTVENTRLQGIL